MKRLAGSVGLVVCLLLPLTMRGQTNQVPPALLEAATNAATMKVLLEVAKVKATNLLEWAKKDFDRMGTWRYKVVSLKAGDGSNSSIEMALNDLGKEGWECFWVREKGEELTFCFKKAERSTISEALKYRP